MAASNAAAAVDKRRMILDAAVRVFARQGFHTCRVSDIADEAGVAYGLVYHYFSPRTRCSTRCSSSAGRSCSRRSRDRRLRDPRAREAEAVASFIVDSYRHDPDLMKVIIVEVTRAANTFGQTHLAKIRRRTADRRHRGARPGRRATFRDDVSAQFAAMAFYGAIEQILTGWIFGLLGDERRDLRADQALRGRDDLRRHRGASARTAP